MVVVKRIDAVDPAPSPAIRAEKLLERPLWIIACMVESTAIEDEVEVRIVRNVAVVNEMIPDDYGHGHPPRFL
jgi:hypothetical protein